MVRAWCAALQYHVLRRRYCWALQSPLCCQWRNCGRPSREQQSMVRRRWIPAKRQSAQTRARARQACPKPPAEQRPSAGQLQGLSEATLLCKHLCMNGDAFCDVLVHRSCRILVPGLVSISLPKGFCKPRLSAAGPKRVLDGPKTEVFVHAPPSLRRRYARASLVPLSRGA